MNGLRYTLIVLLLAAVAGASELPVTVEPRPAVLGEDVTFTITNVLDVPITYNTCCYNPSIFDLDGKNVYCPVCLECFTPKDIAPGESLSFVWRAGEAPCPGRVIC